MEFLSKHLTTALAIVALGVLSVGGIALSEHEGADVPAGEDPGTQDVVPEDAGPRGDIPPARADTDDVRPEDAGPPGNVPPAHADVAGDGHGPDIAEFARDNNPSHGEMSGCEFGRAVAAMASQGRSEEDPDREECPTGDDD